MRINGITAILGISLLLLTSVATPVMAGVEPTPWQPQINKLEAVANHLAAIRSQLDSGSIRMGVAPTPWQPQVNHLNAIAQQLGVLDNRVDAVLDVVPAGDPNVEHALSHVASEAQGVVSDAEALDKVLPPECDAALGNVISGAQSIIVLIVPTTVTIVADTSDFEVYQNGFNSDAQNLGDWGVGDTGGFPGDPYINQGRRGLVKFSLEGLGKIVSAQLQLTILQSRKDQYPAPGIIDDIPPFTNPGLGDTVVIHIADYGTPSAAGYGAASIGNDPGVLIPAATEPDRVVSIDVTEAAKQAMGLGASFVAFRIQTATVTDNDGLNDVWFFASANHETLSYRPAIPVSYR
jgi:hypothetical protein